MLHFIYIFSALNEEKETKQFSELEEREEKCAKERIIK